MSFVECRNAALIFSPSEKYFSMEPYYLCVPSKAAVITDIVKSKFSAGTGYFADTVSGTFSQLLSGLYDLIRSASLDVFGPRSFWNTVPA